MGVIRLMLFPSLAVAAAAAAYSSEDVLELGEMEDECLLL